MKLSILLLATILAAGCAQVPTEPHNLFSEFTSADISKVVLARDEPFANEGLTLLPVEVTDRAVIKEMYEACRNTPLSKGMTGPFIGILGHQVFFGNQSNVLAVVHIINWQSNVNLQRGLQKNGKIVKHESDDYWTSGECKAYCRIVYDIMKKNLPGEIEALDEMYLRAPGKTTEQLLFENNDQHR